MSRNIVTGIANALRRRSIPYLFRASLDLFAERLITIVSIARFRLTSWLQNVQVGRRVEVFGKVIIRSPRGRVIIGDRVQFISSSWRSSAAGVSHPVRLRTHAPSGTIVFGDGSGMSGGSVTARSQTVTIGRNVLIGPDCLIVDSDFHAPWPPEKRGDYSGTEYDAGIDIGDNVWIGARCTILKGVKIGANSIIGAGSVVVSTIPADSLAVGNPARVVHNYKSTGAGS